MYANFAWLNPLMYYFSSAAGEIFENLAFFLSNAHAYFPFLTNWPTYVRSLKNYTHPCTHILSFKTHPNWFIMVSKNLLEYPPPGVWAESFGRWMGAAKP